jgi:hypothetical protein
MLNLASFVLGFTAYASLFFLSLFFQQAQGQCRAGGLAAGSAVPVDGVVSLLFGRLAARSGCMPRWCWATPWPAWRCARWPRSNRLLRAPCQRLLMLLGIGMGLAVPATGMAVMANAPAERAGIASATMNALRQAGMSLGIALLGSLMGLRAVQQFTATAQAAGQQQLAAQARELILQPSSCCHAAGAGLVPRRDGQRFRLGDGRRRRAGPAWRRSGCIASAGAPERAAVSPAGVAALPSSARVRPRAAAAAVHWRGARARLRGRSLPCAGDCG